MKKPDIRSLIILTVFALTPCLLSAKIPEPSNVLFGTVHISGKQILQTDTEVIVVARLANTEIASYQMGSNAAYGDQYLLKIALDSVGNRNVNSTHKNDTINIFVSNILANSITVGERGTVKESNLAVDATDSDTDGMPDYWETQYDLLVYINDASDDKDLDGLSNLTEYTFGSNPKIPDSDGDGMLDLFEYTHGFNPNNPADALLDSDSDGLTNFQESQNNTNPHSTDSDNDGMSDLFEVQYGLNPNDSADALLDSDGDGYTNLQEYQNGTDPTFDDSAAQSQMSMIAQATVFDGDISAIETDQTLTYLTSHNSNQVQVINNSTGKLEDPIITTSKNGNNAIAKLDQLLFVASDNHVFIWDNSLNAPRSVLKDSKLKSGILSLAVDHNNLIAGTADGHIFVWENNSGVFEYDTFWKASSGFITSVGLSDKQIYSVSINVERVVNIWDRLNNNLPLYELRGEVLCCKLPALSHNQSGLVMTGAKTEKQLTSVSFSDNKDKTFTKLHKSNVNVVAATPNHFVSADESGEIYIWNQQSGKLLHQFKAHNYSIRSIKINGNQLITGSVNGEVKIWNFPY